MLTKTALVLGAGGVAKAIAWVAEGKLVYRETVAEGIESAPEAFIDMLKGGNTGKQIVQLSEV